MEHIKSTETNNAKSWCSECVPVRVVHERLDSLIVTVCASDCKCSVCSLSTSYTNGADRVEIAVRGVNVEW